MNNNDAVNYAQLKQSVQETKQYTDQRMVEMDNKLSKTESKLSGGIASAMAMTGLPQAYTPGASMASIGGGTYNGESAVALGVSMVSANGRWVYKLQGSTNSPVSYTHLDVYKRQPASVDYLFSLNFLTNQCIG